MRNVRLVAVGDPERRLLEVVRAGMAKSFRTKCSIDSSVLDPRFALHPERNQYHSTSILEQLGNGTPEIVVGVAAVDLYIPILTFVFGEAQLGGDRAVVSYHRLRQEFYGLPADDALLQERLVKEALHEAGHAEGLTHCDDYECVMAASHSIEYLDIKSAEFCSECRLR